MDYFDKLFDLFLKKYGTKNEENIKEILREEFFEWLPSYKQLSDEYRLYLENYLGMNLNNPFLVELDKGYIDTVIGEFSTMISPYAYTSLLENYNLTFDENKRILLVKNGIVRDFDCGVNTIISHNPYSKNTIQNIKKASLNYDIILGMYGKLNDKDKKNKINKLKLISKELTNYEIDYNEKDDNYFCVLNKKK